ncbi:MAG TPA: hypothetical protein VFH68_25595 [Polyangia bacterium]|jgi:hypothetical protein|nr:hypothetical protein [Polyangia bacterium]
MGLRAVTLDDLTIEDERAVAQIDLYGRLKHALRRSGHRFLVPTIGGELSWDRALFLNLTYWDAYASSAGEGEVTEGADVLCDNHITADEVGHVAWHHVVGRELARQAVGPAGPPSAEALFFSESIASAFDLYLLGRLLHRTPESDFSRTQVPLIAERAHNAGLSKRAFARLLEEVGREPERAFEDMRALLLDVANALLACRGPVDAQRALDRFAGHRFEPLLHHFEISNWILFARAYGARSAGPDAVVRRLDALLRQAPTALGWLAEHWIDADAP